MKIDISKIKDSEGKIPVDTVVDFGKVVFNGGEYDFSPVKITGSIVNIGGSLELKASAGGDLTTPCARCLKPVLVSFDADIYEDLSGEDAAEDLIVKNGNEWELKELVLFSIIQELPLTVLCSEDCKGFCTGCGKNLNEEPCSCVDDGWDERFDILKNFKADL